MNTIVDEFNFQRQAGFEWIAKTDSQEPGWFEAFLVNDLQAIKPSELIQIYME